MRSSRSRPSAETGPLARPGPDAEEPAVCEGCEAPATTADDTGIPLCEPCKTAVAAECDAAPAWGHNRGYEGGYDAGFADGINDAAAGLLQAAKAVADPYKLTAEFNTPPEILRLREAIAACEAAL